MSAKRCVARCLNESMEQGGFQVALGKLFDFPTPPGPPSLPDLFWPLDDGRRRHRKDAMPALTLWSKSQTLEVHDSRRSPAALPDAALLAG